MEITFFPDRGLNPGRLRDRLTLYRVAIKAGFYRKAVQVYHIPIPGDTKIVQAMDLSKNMAARGRGLFSLYIYIENLKNLLVRNHWTDCDII